jgi:hypothetical protein
MKPKILLVRDPNAPIEDAWKEDVKTAIRSAIEAGASPEEFVNYVKQQAEAALELWISVEEAKL